MTIENVVLMGLMVNVALVASAWGRSEVTSSQHGKRLDRIENALGIGAENGGKMNEPAFIRRTECAMIEHVNDTAFKRLEKRVDGIERVLSEDA